MWSSVDEVQKNAARCSGDETEVVAAEQNVTLWKPVLISETMKLLMLQTVLEQQATETEVAEVARDLISEMWS